MRELGRTERALDDLWRPYQHGWRRLLSKHVFEELALRADFDTELLVESKVANRVAAGLVPDCPRCENTCCAGYENVVSLRLKDVAVLMDVERTDLINKNKPRFPPQTLAERPGLVELTKSVLWRTLPVLEQIGPLRRCAALDDDLRCSIHPAWPTSCERFPYSLSAVRREVVWGTRCQSRILRPEHRKRSRELFASAVAAYNERIRDAVLLHYQRPALDALGIGAFLSDPDGDPFEPPPKLPVVS
ncbi:MAG: YkgJ family cysteine cluster protein [Deltaproteobacteria bacterium]